MKKVIDKSSSRGYFNHGWLKTHHTFSFANYYNPRRMQFGTLRVLNDDSVDPLMGFDTHPHKNMEVISIPLKGYLRHGDSVRNTKTITPGDLQVMSTGSGIYHSEYNDSDTEQLEFLQIWIFPEVLNTKPEYNNFDIRPLLKPNELALVLSPDGSTPAGIKQNAWFTMGTFSEDKTVDYKLHRKGNGVYLFVIEGAIEVAEEKLSRRDGIGLWETDEFPISVTKGTHLLLMEVAME
ncbi:MAG: pirin family protein [Mediterranea sp.]|jgi:redox-sensitive bicupin YhaK (pirin superfamily)|nr:pirin family protein [Mediterranea sp.]